MSSLEVSHYCDVGHALWDWRTGVGFQTWCFCTTMSRPDLGSTQHPIQCFRVSVPGDEVAEGLSWHQTSIKCQG